MLSFDGFHDMSWDSEMARLGLVPVGSQNHVSGAIGYLPRSQTPTYAAYSNSSVVFRLECDDRMMYRARHEGWVMWPVSAKNR